MIFSGIGVGILIGSGFIEIILKRFKVYGMAGISDNSFFCELNVESAIDFCSLLQIQYICDSARPVKEVLLDRPACCRHRQEGFQVPSRDFSGTTYDYLARARLDSEVQAWDKTYFYGRKLLL